MTTVLQCERLHAVDDTGSNGQARGRLTGMTLTLGPGVWGFSGTVEDGIVALAQAATGRRAPRSGTLTVAGRRPWRSPALRRRAGLLDMSTALPPAKTVRAALRCIAQARRTSPREDPLERLGLERLASRRPRSLSWSEARGVELAVALTVARPILVALVEPFSDVAGVEPALIRDGIRALADAGACVMLMSSNARSFEGLVTASHTIARGKVARQRDLGGAERRPGALHLWVGADGGGPAGLAAALSRGGAVDEASWRWVEIDEVGVVHVRGPVMAALAREVAKHCSQGGVDVRAMRRATEPPP